MKANAKTAATTSGPSEAAQGPDEDALDLGLGNAALIDLLTPGVGSEGSLDGTSGVTELDVIYEQFAHRLAYVNNLAPLDRALLERWGYDPKATLFTGQKGFAAWLFQPAKGSKRFPVVAFRGTEPTSFQDIRADMAPSIGKTQWENNHEEIEAIFEAAGRCDVVGHSLGASLAQMAAVRYPDLIHHVECFQAPGVSEGEAEDYDRIEHAPAVRYHLAKGDVVDLGGEEHLRGEYFTHDPVEGRSALEAHIGYLLLSPQYATLAESLGLDAATMKQLDLLHKDTFGVAMNAEQLTETHPVERTNHYPRSVPAFFIEQLRQKIGWALTLDGLLL